MFASWTAANWISLLGLILSLITSTFLILNFFISRRISKTSLAINQFNIYNNELTIFIDEAKNIKYEQKIKYSMLTPEDFIKANGISYISLFTFSTDEEIIRNYNPDITRDPNYLDISLFQHTVIFPLERFYRKLLDLLKNILNDKTLLSEYKVFLFRKIERDLLQDYFRICNYEVVEKKLYNLSIFKTISYNPNSFYLINDLFRQHNLFNYRNLDFYKETN